MSTDPGRGEQPGVTTTLVAVYVALYLVGTVWLVTRVYVLNFSTAGPNATAALAGLLVTGWVLVPLGVADVDARQLYLGGSVVAVVAVLGTFLGPAVVSGLAAAVLVTACTALLVGFLVEVRERFAVGAAGGVLLHHVVRSWLDTTPPHASDVGRGIVLGAALVGAAACWMLTTRDEVAGVEWNGLRVSASPAAAFLLVEAAFLGFPGSVALWTLRPYEATLGASVAGLVLGAALVAWRGPPQRLAIPTWGATLVAGGVALVYWQSPLSAAAVVPTQAAAVALLAAGSHRIAVRSTLRTAAGMVVVQTLAVVLVFLFVSAVNWAFMPAPLDELTRGRADVFLLGLPALFAVTVAWAVLRPSDTGPKPGRRSVLGSIAVGAAAVAGAFVPRSAATDRPRAPPYRVLSYNVHQYLVGSEGRYNFGELRDVIADSGAHVVGLQETEGARITSGHVDGVRWLANELGYHAVYGLPTADGGYGVALLSAWPVEKVRAVSLPVGHSPTRPALVATVDAPDGSLPVVVTHFETDHPRHRQADQARRIVDLAGEFDRAVVLGDCNTPAGEAREPYRILDGAFADAWTAAGHPVDGGPTFSASNPRERIDYVWLRGEWSVEAASTVGRPAASDHLGVVAVIDPDS